MVLFGWFKAERIVLIPKDMKHKGKEGLAGYIWSTWLPFTERIPDKLKESFISDVVNPYLMIYPIDKDGFTHVYMMRLEVEACQMYLALVLLVEIQWIFS